MRPGRMRCTALPCVRRAGGVVSAAALVGGEGGCCVWSGEVRGGAGVLVAVGVFGWSVARCADASWGGGERADEEW